MTLVLLHLSKGTSYLDQFSKVEIMGTHQ